MEPLRQFCFCPKCGVKRSSPEPTQPFECGACGFSYYFNPCLAVAAILLAPDDDRALFIRRAEEPKKGKLAIPGGFIEIGETAEIAMRREIKEEVNLDVGPLEFLCTASNEYHFRGVTYPVLDVVFVTRAQTIENVAALDGVESFHWIEPSKVDAREIAFPSIHTALAAYKSWPSERRPSK